MDRAAFSWTQEATGFSPLLATGVLLKDDEQPVPSFADPKFLNIMIYLQSVLCPYMYMCVCVFEHAYVRRTFMCACVLAYMPKCVQVNVNLHENVCMCMCVYVQVQVHTLFRVRA
jgi:hypothetical protein